MDALIGVIPYDTEKNGFGNVLNEKRTHLSIEIGYER